MMVGRPLLIAKALLSACVPLTLAMRGWQRVANGSRNQLNNLVAISFGNERHTIMGTSSVGDGWKYGDDERPCGSARTYEIRAAAMTLGDNGWDVEWTLGSAPRDLRSVLLPLITARGRVT